MMAGKTKVKVENDGELRKKVEYQVACEERAHRIVERLIYNPNTQEELINALHFITPSHYSDIIEERAVSKLCGYPLCPNDLLNVPKQKYVISTKTNKVYDIEARKNFCSGQCYKASKHLGCQVSSDPVWSRKHMRPSQYDFLPLNTKSGKVGDEVIVSKAGEIKEDIKRLEKLEKYQKNLAERIHEHNIEIEKEKEMKKSAKKVIDGDSLDSEKKEIDEKIDTEVNDGNNDEEDCIKRDDSVIYTLDKAMDELSIETNNGGNDKEVSSGHTSKITDTETTNNSVDDVVIEKTTVKETIKHNVKKSSESKRHKEVGPSKSKTDYLMQLLDKRKALLSKMADIQNEENNVSVVTMQGEESNNIGDKIDSMETTKGDIESDNIGDKTCTVEKITENNTSKKEKVGIIEIPEASANKPKEDALPRHEELSEIKASEKSYCKSKVEKKKKGKGFVNDIACDNQKKTKSMSVLDLISRGVRSWITDKTIEYLKVDDDDDGDIDETKSANSVFQKQYKALVAKVDAQEKDFDGLLGEETMDSDFTDKPSAPLPHFEVLREELEEDQIRVREFMKGSFTYKVQEKQTFKKDDGSDKVVLPTVDRYDQMLIRQKIVLDRINRILPDILPPLHLLVQDICTELKELIYTFNLTSNNILFKPAEWTIITLILLRMLSRKMATVQRSFTSPGAEKYFIVMLSSIGASIEQVDVVVNKLLTFEQPRDV